MLLVVVILRDMAQSEVSTTETQSQSDRAIKILSSRVFDVPQGKNQPFEGSQNGQILKIRPRVSESLEFEPAKGFTKGRQLDKFIAHKNCSSLPSFINYLVNFTVE